MSLPIDVRRVLRFPELYELAGPLVICPIDDTLISGPVLGLERPFEKLSMIAASEPTAILTFGGTVERYYGEFLRRRYILNLSGSTTRSQYTRKVRVGRLEDALSLNPAAIAVHINLSSRYVGEMLEAAEVALSAARRFGCPVVGIMYPRGEVGSTAEPEEYLDLKERDPGAYANLISHCIQVGVDMGFDMIKTQYSGSEATFRVAMQTAANVPVVIAGGPLIDEETAISNAVGAVAAGAAGISFARNVFGRDDPKAFISRARQAMAEVWKPRCAN